jgi:hypothetical protein
MLIVAVLVPKQMHQGASQQQQIWSSGEYVAGVIPKQVHAERSNAEQHKEANLRPYEATECRHNRLLKRRMAARSHAENKLVRCSKCSLTEINSAIQRSCIF